MKYKKFDLGNYNIYFYKTKKFKTISVSTVILNNYDVKDITKEKIISDYILNTTKKYNNQIKMARNNMELYEPKIDIYNYYRDALATIIDITFLNEKYTEKGMNKKIIDFYYSILFEPNALDGKFEKNNFKISKEDIKTDLLMQEEDPGTIAFYGAMTKIREDIPLAKDTRGKIEDLEKDNENNTYEYYKNKIEKGSFNVFVIGDLEEDEVIKLVDSNLKNKVKKNDIKFKKSFNLKKSKEPMEVIEKSKFNESIVYLIYKIIKPTKRERKLVLPILTRILGGSSSKLFNVVREKHSLAYYVNATYSSTYNTLYMYAGISKENYEKAVQLMMDQLDEMKKGNITEDEINGVKNSFYSELLKKEDSTIQTISSIQEKVYYDEYIGKELKQKYETVTIEEVTKLCKKLNLDVIYMLRGDNSNENN